jgi:hypothetical protein
MDNGSSSSAAAAFSAFALGYCVFILAVVALTIFIFWRIFKKTGQNGAMSLIALIPGIGTIIVLCMLAFGKWPIETELEQHRMMHGGIPATPAPPNYPGYPQPGQPQPPYTQYPMPPQYPPQQY